MYHNVIRNILGISAEELKSAYIQYFLCVYKLFLGAHELLGKKVSGKPRIKVECSSTTNIHHSFSIITC